MTRWRWSLALVIALTVAAVFWPRPAALVVYCAHDAVFSEAILRRFERETGIPVVIRFDTEATKSLSLVNRLLSEKDRPQCDVFWNNELLGTMALAEAGALEPYQGSGYARIPDRFKDAEGRWTGFAARFRVWIVNTEKMEATEAAIDKCLEGDLSRVAVAVPIYGTTLTHYSLLWHAWGPERLQSWHRDAVKRGLNIVPGNARSMSLVAQGVCDAGWTDTDDFFAAKDDGKPVAMLPVRIDRKTITIPNTVSIVRGTRRREAAQKLVDFLLSEPIELELARSKSRQVPLGSVADADLPEEVRELRKWLDSSSDLRPLLPARNACLDWLQREMLQ